VAEERRPDDLDVIAVAAALGMTKYAVRKAIARGTLAARRVRAPKGTKYVVPASEINRYATEHRMKRRDA